MRVELQGIAVHAAGREILHNINLLIEPGEVLAIAGPSGSGKTTLLNVIGLLQQVSDGAVLIDGVNTLRWRDRQRTKFWHDRASFIFQDYGLIEDKTVLYNVAVSHASLFGIRASTQKEATAVLSTVGLADRVKTKVAALSGGEKQRVGIARALFKKSDLILADEPTASLDRANRESVTQLLRSAAAQGATVVVATHDEELLGNCDRVYWLNRGEHQPAA